MHEPASPAPAPAPAPAPEPIVHVIDDDRSVRAALEDLLTSVGLRVRAFGSVGEFLAAPREDTPGCLILDVRMPGQSGMDFHRQMGELGIALPVIFITGHGDIAMGVEAMKNGALEFLTKPFRDQDLLDAIQRGIEQDRARRTEEGAIDELRQRWASLNAGEQAVIRGRGAGSAQQADRGGSGGQRDHREGPARAVDAQDAGQDAGGSGADVRPPAGVLSRIARVCSPRTIYFLRARRAIPVSDEPVARR